METLGIQLERRRLAEAQEMAEKEEREKLAKEIAEQYEKAKEDICCREQELENSREAQRLLDEQREKDAERLRQAQADHDAYEEENARKIIEIREMKERERLADAMRKEWENHQEADEKTSNPPKPDDTGADACISPSLECKTEEDETEERKKKEVEEQEEKEKKMQEELQMDLRRHELDQARIKEEAEASQEKADAEAREAAETAAREKADAEAREAAETAAREKAEAEARETEEKRREEEEERRAASEALAMQMMNDNQH